MSTYNSHKSFKRLKIVNLVSCINLVRHVTSVFLCLKWSLLIKNGSKCERVNERDVFIYLAVKIIWKTLILRSMLTHAQKIKLKLFLGYLYSNIQPFHTKLSSVVVVTYKLRDSSYWFSRHRSCCEVLTKEFFCGT